MAKTKMEGLDVKYFPARLSLETTGQIIYLSGYTLEDNHQTLKCIYPPQDFTAIYLGHLDKMTLTHPKGNQTFKGFITEWNGSDSFTVKIDGEISQTINAIEELRYPDISPIEITGGTFGGAELKIEYDDYRNFKPGGK